MTRARDLSNDQSNNGGAVAPFLAGKNKIINGDFGVWQRGTSFSNPVDATYTVDRFAYYGNGSGATKTISQQTFTPGTAPVAGYEGTYFYRFNQSVAGSGATYSTIVTRLEDCRLFAGQTATFSVWLKADAARTLNFNVNRNYGSGGSAMEYSIITDATVNVTTSWARYTWTVTLPSVAGKTIGAGSFLELGIKYPLNTTETIDIWGWQFESGSVATPFTTASGSIGGELALCQRYYAKSYALGTAPQTSTQTGLQMAYLGGTTVSNNFVYSKINFPVSMRTAPTVTIYSQVGTAGRVSDVSAGSDQGANTGSLTWITETTCAVYNNSGGNLTGTNGGVVFHYVANGEL